jgi:hypothetical protein
MKTYQVWFVNEDVLLVQAEKTNASDNLATFYVGEEMVAAFSFDQILGFSSVDSIVGDDDDLDDEE